MPRMTKKEEFLKFLEQIAGFDLLMLELFGKNNAYQLKEEDTIFEELLLAVAAAESCRYTAPFIHHSVPKSNHFLSDVLPNLDEFRFRQIVRVSWKNFEIIYDLIKDDDVFQGPRSCMQFPTEMQLIIVLYRLGSSGEGASLAKIARFFGIGDGGTIQIITARIFRAILNVRKKFLFWPDDAERNTLVSETFNELPHCVGYVDGTEIKLAEKPSHDHESYFSRKHIYSLKVQATCDYKLRVRHIVLGYPGSVHDARIYKECELNTNSAQFLKGAEWIAGDSAYKLTSTVITPFRSNSNELTLQQRNDFNKTFSRYRVRIEHCFGRMKERFNSLKELKIQINNDESVKFASQWVLVCAILHNIILEQNEKDVFEISDDLLDDLENENPHCSNQNFSSEEGEVKRRCLLEIIRAINL